MTREISSGGVGAIASTFKHAYLKTGLFRSARALLKMNSKEGFDCPGCAWPEPKRRSTFEFCENGAKTLMAATTKKVIDENFARSHTLSILSSWSEYELTNAGRLVVPLLRRPHQEYFQPVSYKEAFDIAGVAINRLKNKNRAAFYTSGRASNEAAFLYQLLARSLGTNNLCDCSNLCHESSGIALMKSIGVGKGTVQLEDFSKAQVIFLIGHNPSSNHPRMLSTLQEARQNGAAIVVINPLMEPGLVKFRHPQKVSDMLFSAKQIATHYYQIRVSGDLTLFNAIAYELLLGRKAYRLNDEFIDTATDGFVAFKEALAALDFNELLNSAGVTDEEIKTLAELIAHNERVIYAWGMGITQTTHGVSTIQAIVNLALLFGHIGKAGAGLCPVRGHSNVQGNRTVGITEKPTKEFLSRLGKCFKFTPPERHGLDVVQSINAMEKGDIDLFIALGGNFLSASPDTERTSQSLGRIDFAINIATSLNKTHLIAGQNALVLPCLTRIEKDTKNGEEQIVTVENSMSIVHASRGHFPPIRDGIPSEVAIIAEIGKRVQTNGIIDWQAFHDNYSRIREAIEACLDDFKDYNQKITNPDGFLLPNPASFRKFPKTNNRACFFAPTAVSKIDGHHDLLLTTIRSHDQFNTSIYGLNDRYRGVKNDRNVIFINELDIKKLRLCDGMQVSVTSLFLQKKRTISKLTVRSHNIKPGCAAAYFPEANALVPLESVALESNTPTSKLVPIIIEPLANSKIDSD